MSIPADDDSAPSGHCKTRTSITCSIKGLLSAGVSHPFSMMRSMLSL